MKNYSDEIFAEKLRSHTCVKNVYQNFVNKFLSGVDSVVQIRILRVKFNIKPWFDIDVLNDIRNRDKYYKKFEESDKENNKGTFKNSKLLLKKLLIIRKDFTFNKKSIENLRNPREL